MNANKALRTVLAVAVFVVVMAGLGAGSAGAQTAAGDDRAAALRILELVNRDRTNAGLAPLADRSDVTAVAASWSAYMAQQQALSHSDDYFSADSHKRLSAKALGENVARNGNVDDAHARLMAHGRLTRVRDHELRGRERVAPWLRPGQHGASQAVRGSPVVWCTNFPGTCAWSSSAAPPRSLPGATSRLWRVTNSSAGSKTRSRQ